MAEEVTGDKIKDDKDMEENEEVENEKVIDEAVEVPIYIKVHYNYTNEHTLYLSIMY